MAEETTQTPTIDTNYIEQIKQLKANTVSKDEYDRVLNDNKQLVDALVNGGGAQSSAEDKPTLPTDDEIQKMRDSLYVENSGISNLDFMRKTLDLRDAIMARGGRDPFLPQNHEYVENEYDKTQAANLANSLRQIVDEAGNDSALFNVEMKRVCK